MKKIMQKKNIKKEENGMKNSYLNDALNFGSKLKKKQKKRKEIVNKPKKYMKKNEKKKTTYLGMRREGND